MILLYHRVFLLSSTRISLNVYLAKLNNAISNFEISGIVISNLSELEILPNTKLDIIGNYTLNLYNSFTANKLNSLEINTITISPELDKEAISSICNSSYSNKELIVYGNTPLMTMNYCLLGKSNKCYNGCTHNCNNEDSFYLKDRMGFKFRVLPDNIQTISTIYNSKITSISYTEFNVNNVRIDILDESVDDINSIVSYVISGNRIEGKDFTNGNINRII